MSCSEYYNNAEIGICLQDEFGMFIGSKTVRQHPVLTVDIGEVLDLLAVLEWTGELDCSILLGFYQL